MDLDRLRQQSQPSRVEADRRAAVLIPVITPEEAPRLLFTKRADWLSRHPGQMSFPGGSREPHDDGPIDTAYREAFEEVGLKSSEAEPVGQLPEIVTVSDFAVTPIVARVPDRVYEPDHEEVVEIAVIAVETLQQGENYERAWRESPDGEWKPVDYFYVDGYTIWGTTGALVATLLSLTTDWQQPEPPVSPE